MSEVELTEDQRIVAFAEAVLELLRPVKAAIAAELPATREIKPVAGQKDGE